MHNRHILFSLQSHIKRCTVSYSVNKILNANVPLTRCKFGSFSVSVPSVVKIVII
jgi:hypothetical protein